MRYTPFSNRAHSRKMHVPEFSFRGSEDRDDSRFLGSFAHGLDEAPSSFVPLLLRLKKLFAPDHQQPKSAAIPRRLGRQTSAAHLRTSWGFAPVPWGEIGNKRSHVQCFNSVYGQAQASLLIRCAGRKGSKKGPSQSPSLAPILQTRRNVFLI